MKTTLLGLALGTALLGACGGSESAGSAGDDGQSAGGNVSFGGAQDIGQFRAALERGEIPEQGSLDANGFFSEHYNATPANGDCTGALCLTPGLSVAKDWITGAHQATLQVAVSTTIDPSTLPHLPMNLVVVVDHSGSMASDGRLQKVKVGLNALVDNLGPDDRLAIIKFDDTVDVDLPLRSTLDRAAAHIIINNMQPDGSTDLYDGLEAGFRQFGDVAYTDRQNRVIFLSDGLATAGNTSEYAIMNMAKGYISRGIGLTTIGVGDDFDVALMKGLAENGAGNYYFLEDATAAGEVFTEELAYFMTPIALDLNLTVAAGSGWTFDGSVGATTYASSLTTGTMSIPAAFVASRTSQQPGEGRRGGGSMIFVRLEANETAGTQVADLQLSYRVPGSQEVITTHTSLDYAPNPQDTPADPYLSGPELAERFAMEQMYLGLFAATNTYGAGCSLAVLEATKRTALTWSELHPDPDLSADLELVDMFIGNLQARGAVASDLAACQVAQPWPTADSGSPDDVATCDGQPCTGMYACSAANFDASWLSILGVAGLVVVRRRRKR
ncbi:MAG TPA: VWA domain-containing protein [Kofleriaceae bacterium]|jgi:Ca-activated chloride channel family protein